MKASWIIQNNHIALECGNKILHPSASDIYSMLADKTIRLFNNSIECNILISKLSIYS